ncbi:MAG: hypothetical protein LBB77_05040 [Treponema sp.]|jgi:hypothetical protein|nr:hypothetical protein [Treponema sp.]
MMETDFYGAYQRHWRDAEYLYTDSRLANADQLYGYSAECGLKCLMQCFGMPLNPVTENPPKKDRVHIDQAWDRYEAYRSGIGAAGYTLPQPNPFSEWHISHRYTHTSRFSQIYVDQHRAGAMMVRVLINKAILEGKLII